MAPVSASISTAAFAVVATLVLLAAPARPQIAATDTIVTAEAASSIAGRNRDLARERMAVEHLCRYGMASDYRSTLPAVSTGGGDSKTGHFLGGFNGGAGEWANDHPVGRTSV